MPIFKQTYRGFEGTVPGRLRWWTVTKQELRILAAGRLFKGLVLLAYINVLFRVLQVVAFDTLTATQNNPIRQALESMQAFMVNDRMFFDFLRLQAPVLFLTSILAGAGMICDDFQNNLMEVYFSKPLTWRDYVIGKISALAIVGLSFTALPALFLVVLHNTLAPSMETLRATYWLPFSIVVFSLILVAPCVLGVLASSSIFSSQRHSSIGVFMVLFCDLAIGRHLPELLERRNLALIAFPLSLNRLGEAVFFQRRPLFGLSWEYALAFFVAVCVVCIVLICFRVRRAEVAV